MCVFNLCSLQRVFSQIGHCLGFFGSVSGCFSFKCLLSQLSVSNSCMHLGHLKGLLVVDVASLDPSLVELEDGSLPCPKQILLEGSCDFLTSLMGFDKQIIPSLLRLCKSMLYKKNKKKWLSFILLQFLYSLIPLKSCSQMTVLTPLSCSTFAGL